MPGQIDGVTFQSDSKKQGSAFQLFQEPATRPRSLVILLSQRETIETLTPDSRDGIETLGPEIGVVIID